MRSVIKRSAALLAVGIAAPLITAGAASAATVTIHTTPCGTRTDFLKIWYSNGSKTVCYASDGGVPVNYSGVTKITTGNNSGNLETYVNGVGGYLYFTSYETLVPKAPAYVYYITISGR